MDRKPYSSQDLLQLIWGVALAIMGLAFFFRVSTVMEQIAGMEYPGSVEIFLRIGFYLIAVILLGGGIKKYTVSLRSQKTGNKTAFPCLYESRQVQVKFYDRIGYSLSQNGKLG